jgi:hypothetical protein
MPSATHWQQPFFSTAAFARTRVCNSAMPKAKSKNKSLASPASPATATASAVAVPQQAPPSSESAYWGETAAAASSPGAVARAPSPHAYLATRPSAVFSPEAEQQGLSRQSPRVPLRVTPNLRQITVANSAAAVHANEAAASAIAAANLAIEETQKSARKHTISAANDSSENIPPVEAIDSCAVGDLGFTIYPSLSGDYCVDFVPPAVDLSVHVSDRLMEVDGVPTRGKSAAEVVNMMRGPVGSYAAIKLFRFPPTGSPFFVETNLLRLPVLSDELRASMYPNFSSSRKAFAVALSTAASTSAQSKSETIASSKATAANTSAPAPAPAPVPAPAPAPCAESSPDVLAPNSQVSVSNSAGLQMESLHVWTKESLSQVCKHISNRVIYKFSV